MSAYPEHMRLRAALLREQGVEIAAIARRLGVGKNTVLRWVNPTYAEYSRKLAREYKSSLRGVCERCGGETRYGGHRNNRGLNRYCGPCGRIVSADRQRAKSGTGFRQQQLHKLLAKAPAHGYEIRDALKITTGHAHMLIHRELAAGRVVRIKRGVYALNDQK